jgi:hypothetical protein
MTRHLIQVIPGAAEVKISLLVQQASATMESRPPSEGPDVVDDASGIDSNEAWSERNDTEHPEVEIAGKESRTVWRRKLLVLVVLIGSAVAVAWTTHHYISKSEIEQFRNQFEDDANKIFGAIGTSLDKTLGAYDQIAVAFVSHARFANQTWPFVTLPNFALRMAKVLPPSAAITINLIPIVTPEDRLEWEAYTKANDYWVNEGMAVQETWERYYGPVAYNGTHSSVVHGDFDYIPYNTTYVHATF